MKLRHRRWFYRYGPMSEVPIPVDTGDFRLVDRQRGRRGALDAEHGATSAGMFAWVGYDQDRRPLPAGRAARHAKRRLLPEDVAFAADGIVSFTAAPLRLALMWASSSRCFVPRRASS